MTHIFINKKWMVLLDVVYLSMNGDKSYGNVTPKLMEGIMLEIELLTRYCSLDFIGLLSSRMPVSSSYLVMNVKGLVISVSVMKSL